MRIPLTIRVFNGLYPLSGINVAFFGGSDGAGTSDEGDAKETAGAASRAMTGTTGVVSSKTPVVHDAGNGRAKVTIG